MFFYDFIFGLGLIVLVYFIVLFLALKHPYAGLPKDPPVRGFCVREFGFAAWHRRRDKIRDFA